MAHCIVEEAEKILDKEYPVLDKGFIRLVDYMGSDERIVQAARVSYGKGTKTYREDKKLIHYLLRNSHTSPFEQVIFTFHIKLPIFVARQWIRHRTARINEVSGRYSIMKCEFFTPCGTDIGYQSSDNKQGRTADEVPRQLQEKVLRVLNEDQRLLYGHYEEMIQDNVARELARINLPLSLFTEWYWQIDLHNLFHFLMLRLDMHAQKEIRVYAEKMYEIGSIVCPCAFEAFDEYVRYGAHLSRSELEQIKQLLHSKGVQRDRSLSDTLIQKLGI